VSEAVLEAAGSILTNKYAEGLPGKRYYGGCEFIDEIEDLARERAKRLFGAEFVNVQPHSGASANLAVFEATVNPGDTIMGMRLDHGGHLTHGSPVNFSGKRYNVVAYGVNKDTQVIDEDEVWDLARKHRPKLIICGASAYSRRINWELFGNVAREIGSVVMADIAHYAGLVAAGVYPSPVPYCQIVTTTTHKTLRGPRAGLIMGKDEFSKALNKSVFPGLQGGPLEHIIAAKAVCFKEALQPEFKQYATNVIENAKALAETLMSRGLSIVSGGTDSHVLLVDLQPIGISGKEAQECLDSINITANKNTIPFDPQPPTVCSGIRIGTPAITTRGMGLKEMKIIAGLICDALQNKDNPVKLKSLADDVRSLASGFPIYRHRLV
ncbi:MAG: serine hydroxymethyltransferase, partial [SAR324 cluster bacterium]|nr:serine hydroxymethyltransferase [SAR324 cluster bacterium]